MSKSALRRLHEALVIKADASRHEETTTWCNRDLVPLPPSRRTWGWFNFFGVGSLGALNVATWQTPNTLLTQGLSVGQAMAVLVFSRIVICFFACVIAECGIWWHIGFTVQSRFTWGMRGAYIPLVQRSLLNFVWCAVQCWNGGRLVAVALTAVWPSYRTIPNTLGPDMPMTTQEFLGFIIFWIVSLPFLWIRPERFKKPFFFSSLGCGLAMVAVMAWSLVASHGRLGAVFYKGEDVPSTARFGVGWIILAGMNQAIGQKAAGIANESDFSRYASTRWAFAVGTCAVQGLVGVLVSIAGLLTTAACQVVYGRIFWNPPDLMLVMMDHGTGSAAARAGVFFLALAFTFAVLFQNVCGNVVAGGIDLAGIFPRYIDIRRGAILTFVTAAWVVQPWQLINKAATFVTLLSSFSVFLAPLMGVMIADYFFVRQRKIRLSHLYQRQGSDYWFTAGLNWRVVPCWIAGWAPTIGGLIVTAGEIKNAPDLLFQLYYTAFFSGLSISFVFFLGVNYLSPVRGAGKMDEYDNWGTFTLSEAALLGVMPNENAEIGVDNSFGKSGYEKRPTKISAKDGSGQTARVDSQ